MRQPYLPTVSELQAFSACARLGATTRAALELNLTQSAVSRTLNGLEDRLGVRLFHRIRQRLVLSDAGRALLPEADRLLDDLNRSALAVMAFGGQAQLLRLAVLPTLGSIWLIPRLSGFKALNPAVTFDISVRLAPVDFNSEPFDAAIQRGGISNSEVAVRTLMDEELIVVAAPELMQGRSVLDDDALTSLPLLQQSTRPNLWLDWFRHAGRDPRMVLRGSRFDHFEMVINAAIAGLGAAIVPEVLVRKDIAGGRLLLASQRRMAGPDPYSFIYPRHLETTGIVAEFRDWLVEMAGEENGASRSPPR